MTERTVWVVDVDRSDIGRKTVVRSTQREIAKQFYSSALRRVLSTENRDSSRDVRINSVVFMKRTEVDGELIDGGEVISIFSWY